MSDAPAPKPGSGSLEFDCPLCDGRIVLASVPEAARVRCPHCKETVPTPDAKRKARQSQKVQEPASTPKTRPRKQKPPPLPGDSLQNRAGCLGSFIVLMAILAGASAITAETMAEAIAGWQIVGACLIVFALCVFAEGFARALNLLSTRLTQLERRLDENSFSTRSNTDKGEL